MRVCVWGGGGYKGRDVSNASSGLSPRLPFNATKFFLESIPGESFSLDSHNYPLASGPWENNPEGEDSRITLQSLSRPFWSRVSDPAREEAIVRSKSWLRPFHHKTGFTSLFCRLQGKLRHGPLPVTVLPCWPRFMTPTFGQSSADHESTETTHCSFFFFFLLPIVLIS